MAALGRLFVAVPPLAAQDQIVRMIQDQTATSAPVVRRMKDCLDKLFEYRSALITAAVTGQIDVREYAKEAN
jgi:type I restriction enzyme S subunit